MNKTRFLVFLVLLTPLFGFSQEIVLSSMKVPGSTSVGVISGAVLGENLLGPRKIVFFSEQSNLQKRSVEKKSTKVSSDNSVLTLYSGRIFSPGIAEPFVFKDKTKEELVLLEAKVFPIRLEEPYTLYIDLTVSASSTPAKSNKSVEAGDYIANLSINLIEI